MSRPKRAAADDLRDALRASGARFTRQRAAVLDAFASARGGLTVAEAAARLRPAGIGAATVYRNARLLESLGFLARVPDQAGSFLYLARPPGHVHVLVCRACGRIEPFTSCDFGVLGKLLEVETGYWILNHKLEVHGFCPGCHGEPR
ncbi:MAG: Fur family transcriptional regulator [Candidatus Eisenbacteria bacterium]